VEILESNKQRDSSGIWINLPIVIAFPDYHDMHEMARMLNGLHIKDSEVKAKEIGFRNGQYVGIIYLRKQDEDFERLKKKWATRDTVV